MSVYQSIVRERPARLGAALLARPARPLRFAIVGGTGAVVQLAVLGVLVSLGLQPFLANAAGMALAAQVNFLLSQAFTWHDRHGAQAAPRRGLLARWATFHACISVAAAVNLGVFALALHVAPHLLAGALGIAAGASLNFLSNDRLTFRRPPAKRAASAGAGDPAALRVS